jgi:hypothetical protein
MTIGEIHWVEASRFVNVARKPERTAAQGCGIRAIPKACTVDGCALRLPYFGKSRPSEN